MRVRIRLATRADAADILEIYAPIVRDTHISFETLVPSEAEIAERISRTLRQYPWLVCEINAKLAGYAYASPFRARAAYQWTAETTVYIHPEFQGRGVARALYSSLIAIIRNQGYRNAIGVIALPNAASVRAHEAIGFRKVGVIKSAGYKNGDWRDTGWWQLELHPPQPSPLSPRSIQHLTSASGFDQLLEAGLPSIKA